MLVPLTSEHVNRRILLGLYIDAAEIANCRRALLVQSGTLFEPSDVLNLHSLFLNSFRNGALNQDCIHEGGVGCQITNGCYIP